MKNLIILLFLFYFVLIIGVKGRGDKEEDQKQIKIILKSGKMNKNVKIRFEWIEEVNQENNYKVVQIGNGKKIFIGCNICKKYFPFNTNPQFTTHNNVHNSIEKNIRKFENNTEARKKRVKELKSAKDKFINNPKLNFNEYTHRMKQHAEEYLTINEKAGVYECELCKSTLYSFIISTTGFCELQTHFGSDKHQNPTKNIEIYEYNEEQETDDEVQQAAHNLMSLRGHYDTSTFTQNDRDMEKAIRLSLGTQRGLRIGGSSSSNKKEGEDRKGKGKKLSSDDSDD